MGAVTSTHPAAQELSAAAAADWTASAVSRNSACQRFIRSDLQPDRTHQFHAVALSYHTLAQSEIECHPTVPQLVLKVHVVEHTLAESREVGHGEIVSGDQPNGATRNESPHDPFRA